MDSTSEVVKNKCFVFPELGLFLPQDGPQSSEYISTSGQTSLGMIHNKDCRHILDIVDPFGVNVTTYRYNRYIGIRWFEKRGDNATMN